MLTDLFHQEWPSQVLLRVTPKAKKERVQVERTEEGQLLIRVYVTAVAEDGKANEAVIHLLSKTLCLSKSALTITRGHKCRDKILSIAAR